MPVQLSNGRYINLLGYTYVLLLSYEPVRLLYLCRQLFSQCLAVSYCGRIALRRDRRRPCRSASRGVVMCA